MRKTLGDFEIAPSHAAVSIERIEEQGIFEIRIALLEGSPFVWSGRIREDRFDSDLRASMAALRVWL